MVSIPRIMYNILYPGNSTQFLTVSKLTQPYFKEIFKKLELVRIGDEPVYWEIKILFEW